MLRSLLKDIYARGSSPHGDDDGHASGSPEHERWLDELIVNMFRRLHNFEPDNFDAERYRTEQPNAFFADRHAAYFTFLLKNVEHFFRARQLLEDEASRALYDHLILFRVLGHLHTRLPFNTPENRAHIATAASWRVEDTKDMGPFGPLSIFLVPGQEHDIQVKGWKENITWTF